METLISEGNVTLDFSGASSAASTGIVQVPLGPLPAVDRLAHPLTPSPVAQAPSREVQDRRVQRPALLLLLGTPLRSNLALHPPAPLRVHAPTHPPRGQGHPPSSATSIDLSSFCLILS
eukprot:NODE_9094_length_488_cov_8.826879_g8019_i0.p2 GENE.NODE_9094_length_488_cov_8.826879_g8019_i0~~NODE_9094_length_488_cov_8.826879_g8019_i0.p2  ORF type:complete len:119 (-),score=5.22 NODE_9094_length_488_cov_8.826879_g8019_i0:12-368(-)